MPSAHRVTLEDVIDRPGSCMRCNGAGFALAIVVFQASEVLLPRRMVPKQQDGGLREGPRERGLAELRTGGPGVCPLTPWPIARGDKRTGCPQRRRRDIRLRQHASPEE